VHDGTDVTVLWVVIRLLTFKSKYSFSNHCYNDIMKLITDLIPVKHNMMKDLYQSKKIMSDLKMNYEKIDAYEKNYMLFWKEHKNNTECMYCGRSRYVKVINEDGASVTTKVTVKQFCYIPITTSLKWLFLYEKTTQQKRWHKKEIHDSEDVDIMSHPMDAEAWHALDHFDPEGTTELAVDYYDVHQTILKYTFGGTKELKVVFFECDWFDPVNSTRVDDFGMMEVK
jgi:hypothetical protein